MEEIDLFLNPDAPMPPGIQEDDDDSERDIPILEELLDNYSLSLPTNESYHFDIPSPYRPPAKPPDGNTGTLNIKMLGDVSDQKRLLYDNSSPRPPEEFVSENSNADAESFSPYPVEEIDLTFTHDDPMPPSIKEDDDDSKDILIREELLDNYSLPIP
nr:hypothetical protein [Tanacetum cinerariifolium]